MMPASSMCLIRMWTNTNTSHLPHVKASSLPSLSGKVSSYNIPGLITKQYAKFQRTFQRYVDISS